VTEGLLTKSRWLSAPTIPASAAPRIRCRHTPLKVRIYDRNHQLVQQLVQECRGIGFLACLAETMQSDVGPPLVGEPFFQ